MDVPSPVDRATPTPSTPAGATPAVSAGEARPGTPLDPDLGARLALVERQMAEIGERLDRLAASVPETLRDVVAEQVGDVSADLRHSVSDLGRLLLRDLGRLTQVLAEHRDQIVADLRKAGGVAAGEPGPALAAASVEPEQELASEQPDSVDTDATSETAKRRQGKHLLKRREG